LRRALELAGVEALPPGGVLHVEDGFDPASGTASIRLRRQAYEVLVRGLPLTVSFGAVSGATLESACDVLRDAADRAGTGPATVELVAPAWPELPRTVDTLRRARLGHGVTHVLADGALLQPTASRRRRRDRFWRQMWRARGSRRLRMAFATDVWPTCGLLSAEAVRTVLPQNGAQVPAGSAWLGLRIDLARFCDARGRIGEAALERALRDAVEIGDQLHDLVAWPTAPMRHDAWLNRRLGVHVDGVGDLLGRRGHDPRRFANFSELDAMLTWMRDTLTAQSRAIAIRTRAVPVLEQGDPSRRLPGSYRSRDWQARWRAAVSAAAVRHRNLFVMSPWSLFPAGRDGDRRYADLLPLLRHADACTGAGLPGLHDWNINDFKAFHLRAWAVLQQREARRQIAE
jgi:hypothetical protein